MATYVMSDIHGDYDSYRRMLEKIHFSADDRLYILGDIMDRGEHPIKVMLDIMERPNVIFLIGNHEHMFCECMKFLLQEVTDESVDAFDEESSEMLANWIYNGAEPTMKEFRELSIEDRRRVADYVLESEVYEEVRAGGKDWVLVHAGFDNFSPEKRIWEYELAELIWRRPDYHTEYYKGKFIVMGHTPTQYIEDAPRPGYIYHCGNNTVIDCGVNIPGGRLACLRLDDGEEFYIEK